MQQNLMEGLEARTLMAVFTVTNTADIGAGSLRQAIDGANAAAGADTIEFAGSLNGDTITLGGSQLSITGDLTISGPGASALTVSGNNASRVFSIGTGATVYISGLRIIGGNTSNGAGIFVNGTLTLTNSTVSGNTAVTEGGGIFNFGTLTVIGSTISGNSGTNGGGIENQGTATVTNSTVSGNAASLLGGGIHNLGPNLTVRNTTIAGNLGGGGMRSDLGNPLVISTIIAGNAGGDVLGNSFATGSDNNLIQDAAHAGGAMDGVNGNHVGVDPLLGPLVGNGGSTRTIALRAGSPAIDAGINPGGLTTDQRGAGFSRTVGSAIDIGAFEFGNASTLSAADIFIEAYAAAPKAADGLVDGDWIADTLKSDVPNVATSNAYWGAQNNWFQDSKGDVWSLWNGGSVHDSTTLSGQHEWVLTNLTDAAGLSGTMRLAPGSLSGITTGWNAFNIQGIQDGRLAALWWSPAGSAGTYVDTDGTTKQGGAWGNRGNGWSLSSISDAATNIGGAIAIPPAAFLPYTESQGNGRTEFDPRPARTIANTGMSVVVVGLNHRVYVVSFSTSQRAIAGARPDLNGTWVIEPLAEVPSIADFGLAAQEPAIEQTYIVAATN